MAELNNNAQCGFCNEDIAPLETPKVLPCGHVHCLECLTGDNRNGAVRCPECR